jgi:hypothetical protein
MTIRMTSTVAMIIHAVSPLLMAGGVTATEADAAAADVVAISTAIDSAEFAPVVSTVGSAKENSAKLNKAIRIKIFTKYFIGPP